MPDWFSIRNLLACTSLMVAIARMVPTFAASPNSSIASPGMFAMTGSGCKVWVYAITRGVLYDIIGDPSLTVTWSGDCIDGKASGTGILESENLIGKTHYEGGMREGKMNGHGTATLPDGQTIEGDFIDGIIEGRVVYNASTATGMHYEGEWHNGGGEGHGKATWPSGTSYDGNWHNGKESGFGVMKYPASHSTYKGEFVDGKREGHGILARDAGGWVEAEWKDDAPTGQVQVTTRMGDHYAGEFSHWTLNGHGTMVSHTGARYIGEWRAGVPEGEGMLTRPGEAPYSGIWRQGCFNNGERRTSFGAAPSTCP